MKLNKFQKATFDTIKELAEEKKNQIKFSADKNGVRRNYVLLSPDTNEQIFTIKFRAATENLPWRCDLIVDGENVNLPQDSIYEIMEILRDRHITGKEIDKKVTEHMDQTKVLKFLGRFQTK